MNTPKVKSKWCRKDQVGSEFYYTVLFITNTANKNNKHPEQVVYQGSNGFFWSLPLSAWPGSLIELEENNE